MSAMAVYGFKMQAHAQDSLIIVLTGASGVGKTTLVETLAQEVSPPPLCLHFDSIGIPTVQEMLTTYGSTRMWQKAMTEAWIERLVREYHHAPLIIFEGQTDIEFIEAAFSALRFSRYKIILVSCTTETRKQRLVELRQQPELANPEMEAWSQYLSKQAEIKGLPELNTTRMSMSELIVWFKNFIRQELESTASTSIAQSLAL